METVEVSLPLTVLQEDLTIPKIVVASVTVAVAVSAPTTTSAASFNTAC